MRWFWSLLDWIGRFQIIQGFVANLWAVVPIGWLVGTGVAGYVTSAPLMWILVAMAASAAFICMTIFFGAAIQLMKDPENKIKFVGANVGIDFQKQKSINSAKRIQVAQVMIIIRNDANFPISVYIESANSSIEGIMPPRTSYPKPATLVGAGGVLFMADERLDMSGFACGSFTGFADFRIRYGRAGKEKHELVVRGVVTVPMDTKGALTGPVMLSHTT